MSALLNESYIFIVSTLCSDKSIHDMKVIVYNAQCCIFLLNVDLNIML